LGYYCITTTFGSTCRERCGDGVNLNTKYGHPCDDGNTLSKDGCDSTCNLGNLSKTLLVFVIINSKIESGFTCTVADATGNNPSKCTEDCDGTWKFFLPCDSGPGNNGCCNNCVSVNTGCTCTRGAGCSELCGSGLNLGLNPSKECDDGNADAAHEYYGDGCDWKCKVEPGFTCPVTGKCTETCGAGTWDSYNYECDDGNNANGDGCDSNCVVEYGFYCYNGNPLFKHDKCYEICGDGKDLNNYWCDDGNTESGDGCSSICHVERGYSCVGGTYTTPDVCTEICGD